jgi:hypothetical protein
MTEKLEIKTEEEPRCGWNRDDERAHIKGGVVHSEKYSFCSRAYAQGELYGCSGTKPEECKFGSYFGIEGHLGSASNYQENLESQQ